MGLGAYCAQRLDRYVPLSCLSFAALERARFSMAHSRFQMVFPDIPEAGNPMG